MAQSCQKRASMMSGCKVVDLLTCGWSLNANTVAFQPVTPVRGAYKDRKVSGRYRLFSAVESSFASPVDRRLRTVRATMLRKTTLEAFKVGKRRLRRTFSSSMYLIAWILVAPRPASSRREHSLANIFYREKMISLGRGVSTINGNATWLCSRSDKRKRGNARRTLFRSR